MVLLKHVFWLMKYHVKYEDCNCPIEKKILNFATYKDQIFERDAIILLTEDENTHYEVILSGNHEINLLVLS